MSKLVQLSIFFCSLTCNILFSQKSNTEVVANIEVKQLADLLNISGTVKSKTNLIKSLNYQMLLFRKDFSTSQVRKAEDKGRFVLKPNQKLELAKIEVNKNTKDKVTLVILIFDDNGKLVSKDRKVVLNNDEDEVGVKPIRLAEAEKKYIGLTGLVKDRTKTKHGRDFYREFYSSYRLKGIDGKEIVKIVEQFSFGRNTIMEIKIGSTVIYSFFVQPKNDYIKRQAEQSIRLVSRYFLNLEQQRNYIKQY